MAIKMVAIDLDDTLLDSRYRIAPPCIEAIHRARDKGILVTLATGRMFQSALPYAQLLGIDLPLICYQGALVKSTFSGEVLYQRCIRAELARELLEVLQKAGSDYHMYSLEEMYISQMTPILKEQCRITGIEPILINNIHELLEEFEPVEIMALFAEEAERREVQNQLTQHFGSELHITPFKYNSLEIMDGQATKARALASLADQFHILQEEIMAIGDSYNDLPMIEWAGIGVAVANADELVKAKADYITASNDEQGVARALEEYVL